MKYLKLKILVKHENIKNNNADSKYNNFDNIALGYLLFDHAKN
jgi:hypothetical protein